MTMRDSVILRRLIRLAHEKRHPRSDIGINHVSPLIFGYEGNGKTYITTDEARQIKRERESEAGINFGIISINCSALDNPCDLEGFPEIVETGDAIGYNRETRYIAHDWMNSILHDYDEGILILDEFLRASPPVMNAMHQFVQEGRLNNHELPNSWTIVAVTNPPEGAYDVEEMDAALRDRFLWFPYGGDKESYLEYVEDNIGQPFHSSWPNFVQQHWNSDYFEAPDLPYSVEPTGRSSELFHLLWEPTMDRDFADVIACGLLGAEEGDGYLDYVRENTNELVSAKDILEHYPQVRGKIQELQSGQNTRFDMLQAIRDRVREEIKTRHEKGESIQQYRGSIKDFIMDLPPDFVHPLIEDLVDIDQSTVSHPDIIEHIGGEIGDNGNQENGNHDDVENTSNDVTNEPQPQGRGV